MYPLTKYEESESGPAISLQKYWQIRSKFRIRFPFHETEYLLSVHTRGLDKNLIKYSVEISTANNRLQSTSTFNIITISVSTVSHQHLVG